MDLWRNGGTGSEESSVYHTALHQSRYAILITCRLGSKGVCQTNQFCGLSGR